MIADNLYEFLAEKLFYKKGVELCVNHVDDKATEAVVLFDTGSVGVESYVDLDAFTVQVIVISKTHAIAKKKSIDIYKLINRKQGLEMDGKTIKYCKALQTPYNLGYEKGVWKFTTNYVLNTCI